jgi:WD40 repeat protein
VYLWDVATGKALAPLAVVGQRGPHHAVTFSPDSKTVAVVARIAGVAARIRLYDVASGKELPLPAGLSRPAKAVLMPDGKTLVTNDGSSIELRDATTGEQRWRLEAPEFGGIPLLLFSLDGRRLFFASGGDLYVYDVATWRQLQKYRLGSNSLLASSPDGKRLAVWNAVPVPGSEPVTILQGVVQVIDTTTGKRICDVGPRTSSGPGKDEAAAFQHAVPSCVTFLPDGRSLVVCTKDKAHVYDAATGKELRQIEFAESAGRSSGDPRISFWPVVLSPDGRLIARVGVLVENGRIVVHELGGGTRVCRSEKLTAWPERLAFSPDGRTVAWGSSTDPLVHLLDAATGKERHAFKGTRAVSYRSPSRPTARRSCPAPPTPRCWSGT